MAKRKRWKTISYANKRDVHVIPVADLQRHTEKRTCWCKPKCEKHGGGVVVVHNSADGRELTVH